MNPTIALTLIVRDEAAMAPDFLRAAAGAWDELIVVDTGSTDDTKALFAAAGARVIDSPWQGDFAQARNVALAHVTSDWVLVLDADERPSADFITQLRQAVATPGVGALTIRISNPLPYGHRRESSVLRGWKADARVRFEHAIHEDVSAHLAPVLAERGERVVDLSAAVEHLGYVRERAAAKDKKARDLTILERCLAADPADFYSHLKRLELARYWRDGALWTASARAAADELGVAPADALAHAPWGGELVALVAEALFRPDSAVGLLYLSDWEARVPQSAALLHRRALCHEARGELDKAGAAFEACQATRSLTGDVQLSTVRPLLGRARLALMRGDAAQALRLSMDAVEHAPRDPEALMATAALLRQQGGPKALDTWEAQHRAQIDPCPERDWALGEAALALGDRAQAAQAFRRAAGVPPAGPAALRLAQCWLAEGRLEDVDRLCRSLVADEPEAGLGVLVCDLIHGKDTALELELTADAANVALKQWLDAVFAAGNPRWIQALAANAIAIYALFPWLEAYLRRRAS